MRSVGKIIAIALAAFGLLGLLVAAEMKSSFAVIAIIGIALYLWLNKKQPKKAAKRQQKPQTAAPAKSPTKRQPAAPAAAPAWAPEYLPKTHFHARLTADQLQQVRGLKDYVVIDVETTGLNHLQDKIVQIGIVTVEDNAITDEFVSYVDPGRHIPTNASKINGIADEDVQGAPSYDQIADPVFERLNNKTILGYNAAFDINFILTLFKSRQAHVGEDFDFAWVDVCQFANHVAKNVSNYKLQTLLAAYGIDPGIAHTALDDAIATYYLFQALRADEKQQRELAAQERKERKEQATRARKEKYQDSPLLETRFCFTGDFDLPREEIEELARSVGGMVQDKVNGKTEFLVQGDITGLPEWAVERKTGKAEELIEAGQNLRIISEDEYIAMIDDAKETMDFKSKV